LCYTYKKLCLEWTLSDPVGNILDHDVVRNDCNDQILENILNICKLNDVTIVTHDLNNSSQLSNLKQFIPYISCIMEQSFVRCGVVKLDGKIKELSVQDICNEMNIVVSSVCETENILKIFIEGRIKGWW
jgi:hypothetical protein